MTTIRVKGTRAQVKALLSRLPAVLAGRGPDPRGLARALSLRLGLTALSLVKDAFVTRARGGTDESGLQWAPLRTATIKARRRGAGIGAPEALRDTGVLMNSLSPGAAGNVLDGKPGAVSVGTAVPYARYQHEGTASIPARPLWPDPSRWPARWWAILSREAIAGTEAVIRALLEDIS